MDARRIFFQEGEGWANSGMQRSDDLLVAPQPQVFTTTATNAQNTLQHFRGQLPSEHFIFSRGAPVFVEGGACAIVQWHAQWHNGQSKPALVVLATQKIR